MQQGSPRTFRVSFVRHGESVANVRGEWQGHGDAPLSPRGLEQAAALGERLRTVPFDWYESSDLIRARNTGETLGKPLRLNRAFREIHLGAWEGLTRAEVAERFPEEVAALRAGQPVRIGGGESWEDLYVRTSAALDELKARLEPGQHAVVFSHGGVVTTVFSGLLGVRGRRPFPIGHVLNTAWSTARFEGSEVFIERYNDGTHHPSCRSWSDAQYEADDAIVTYLAWPEDAPPPPSLPTELAEHWLGGVTRVYADDASHARPLATSLGAISVDGIPEVARPRDLGGAHPGARVLVITTPESVVRAASSALGGEPADRPRLATPAPGSLSHVVVSRHGVYLRDYGVGPIPAR
ncbi:MAG: histidine phosphatase family protein [Polyangiaceae bacterium]|nr:histidine phosphatase family protein [Polyangiaceae bacterium]